MVVGPSVPTALAMARAPALRAVRIGGELHFASGAITHAFGTSHRHAAASEVLFAIGVGEHLHRSRFTDALPRNGIADRNAIALRDGFDM